VFLLNSMLFVLVGLQLPSIVEAIDGESPLTIAGYAIAIALTVMVVRFLWVFPFAYLPRRVIPAVRRNDPPRRRGRTSRSSRSPACAGRSRSPPRWRSPAEVPVRDLIVFLVFTTILWTVCVEGLGLPALMRALGVGEDGTIADEENKARLHAAHARSPAWTSSARRTGCGRTPPSACAGCTSSAAGASPRAWGRATARRPTSTGARPTTSACCARSSARSASRSSSCAARAGSATTSCGASSATSTSRRPARGRRRPALRQPARWRARRR
jgi:hypothetical protein